MARGLCHDGRSLTPGGLLLGALSLGDTQDCIIGGFCHSGALLRRGKSHSYFGSLRNPLGTVHHSYLACLISALSLGGGYVWSVHSLTELRFLNLLKKFQIFKYRFF